MSSKGQDLITELLFKEGLNPLLNQQICAQLTIPDWLFPLELPRRDLPVYLDGIKAHQSRKSQARDRRINECLEVQGIYPLRIEYKAPLTLTRAKIAVDYIKQHLKQGLEQIIILEV